MSFRSLKTRRARCSQRIVALRRIWPCCRTLAVASAICAAAVPSSSWAATVAWKSNADGYMSEATNWTGDALPQDGDTLDMSILTTPSEMHVGDFGDERRFETMTLWRTSSQLVLREGTLRLQYLDYSSGSIFGLSSAVVLDVSGKITSTGSRCFAGCGDRYRQICACGEPAKRHHGRQVHSRL